MKGKTADGMRIGDVVRTLMQLPNVSVKEGRRHELLLKYSAPLSQGYAGLCAVGRSTSYQHHILPWVRKVTGYDNLRINAAMQQGSW